MYDLLVCHQRSPAGKSGGAPSSVPETCSSLKEAMPDKVSADNPWPVTAYIVTYVDLFRILGALHRPAVSDWVGLSEKWKLMDRIDKGLA